MDVLRGKKLKLSGNLSTDGKKSNISKLLCIYHHNCLDGFSAAWVIRKAIGENNVEFHKGIRNQDPPDVTGRSVVLVDFSYSRAMIIHMAKQAKHILILDHHKSTAKSLQNFPDQRLPDLPGNVEVIVNSAKSGCMVTWNYYFPNIAPPRLLRHVQDHDLYTFDLLGTGEIVAALASFPYTFEVWDKFMHVGEQTVNLNNLQIEGNAIIRKENKDIAEFTKVGIQKMMVLGYMVPSMNIPYFWASKVGNALAVGNPFAVTWYKSSEGVHYSLRSDKNGLDVSEIAEELGGGGHKHAAGFFVKNSFIIRIDKNK